MQHDQFNRRRYVVEGDSLDRAKRIELIVRVDGKTLVQVQAREPGLLAFVSKPSDQGFEIDIIEATGRRYTDQAVPEGPTEPVADWQYEALGLSRRSHG